MQSRADLARSQVPALENILANVNYYLTMASIEACHDSDRIPDDQIAAVRAFNRFYTRKLGVLEQQLLDSPFSLTEARVLYELAHRDDPSAKEIGAELGLDAGYLSRIVQNFDDDGLITRKPLPTDRRQYQLGTDRQGTAGFRQARPQHRTTTSRRCSRRCRPRDAERV